MQQRINSANLWPGKTSFMTQKLKFTFALMLLAMNLHAQQLFWFIENSRIGYKNLNGVTIIQPQYGMAGNFIDGITYAVAGVGTNPGKFGFIDQKGNWVIQPEFDAADDFREGLARVLKNGKWGYIDTNGKMIIAPQFRLCFSFLNGFAKASVDNINWGLINKEGRFVIESVYSDITSPGIEEVLAVKKTIRSKWQLINIKNEPVSEKEFTGARDFSEGLAPARDSSGKWGFINAKGNWVIEPGYTNAASFSEGLAAVETGYTNWGFIDRFNTFLIQPGYDRQSHFKKGFALVEKGKTYMYIDKTGKVVLPFEK